MARATMAALITRLRRLIGDAAGDSQEWDDDALQDALDETRTVQRYLPLFEEESIAPGGAITYLRFHSGTVGHWEADVALVSRTYAALTPDTADLMTGRWTFATQPPWPVYASGQTYDLFAAAAEMLEQWAAKLKRDYDFSSEGQTFKRSQAYGQMLEQAAKYRAKASARTAPMVRSDVC